MKRMSMMRMKGCYVIMSSSPKEIVGRWHQHKYTIEKELGRGANGIVYLVNNNDQSFALKLGEDSFSITSEVNVLKQFSKAQGMTLGPSLYDVDDWDNGTSIQPFYVMNVIEGQPLSDFLIARGQEWLPIFVMQLLSFLEELHEGGWVFGDLKPDNLVVSGQPPKIAWFDAGGMTKIGRAIKEYTELYDRGYWEMGDRKAEPSYDLFSLAMITLHLHHGQMVSGGQQPGVVLRQWIQQSTLPQAYGEVLWKALNGAYSKASDMRTEWLKAWTVQKRTSFHDTKQSERAVTHSIQKTNDPIYNDHHWQSRGKKHRRKKKKLPQPKKQVLGQFVTLFFVSSILVFLFTLYLFYQAL